jgi:hypothetical protein
MPLLLLVIALVLLAVLASRFGVDSRDGADWSPPDRTPRRSWDPGLRRPRSRGQPDLHQ